MDRDIYFDNASTTMISPGVIKVVNEFWSKQLGNASSVHKIGVLAAREVEKARQILADKIGCRSEEIIFTSGGTEANNLALRGLAYALKEKGNHILISQIEHSSVRETIYWLKDQGFFISEVPVNAEGVCDIHEIRKMLRSDTIFVSIMHANNEVGSLQDIENIGALCREKGILLHTDACQSFGKADLSCQMVDLLSISCHKIHGPTGIGALYVKNGVKVLPIFFGGKQEQGIRSGTYHTEGIVAFGAAVSELKNSDIEHMTFLRDDMISRLRQIPGIRLNGPTGSKRICNNINISLENHSAKTVLLELSKRGIYLSVGSACSAGKTGPSHVLLAMGRNEELSKNSLRISLSKFSTLDEVDRFIKHLEDIIL
jgi:cysteine desulfurase